LASIRKTILLTISVCIVLSSFVGGSLPIAAADVVFDSVTAAPVTSGSVAAFSVSMHVQQDLPANANHFVYVRFPVSFIVPSSIPTTAILLKGVYSPSTVTVQQTADGTTVGLDVVGSVGYPSLLKWEPVTISVLDTAGIRLPSVSGIYPVYLWTDVEPNPVRCNLAVQQSGGNGQSVAGLSVVLGSTFAAGKAGQYDITFQTTSAGGLMSAKGDFIDIVFPDGTVVPSTLDPASVLLRYQNCTKVQVDGLHVRAYLPDAVGFVAGMQMCTITFLPRAGVLLPEASGNYALQAATSQDTSFVLSNQYTVTGTTVITASIACSPVQQGAAVAAQVVFTTSPVGTLLYGTDRVYVQFPAESTVPTSIADGIIKIAGRAVSGVRLGPNRRLEIPVPVDISPMAQVVVTIPENAGIRNPDVAGVYPIRISTSADTDPALVSVTIIPSQIGVPAVALSDRGVGAASTYTVTFATGTGGRLEAGVDRISVQFPERTMIPTVVLAGTVTVNGTPVQADPVVGGSAVVIVTPVSVVSGGQVSVVFGTGAGLHNPSAGGSMTLKVSTTREVAWVESLPVVITEVPVVQALIEPAVPDGQHQWYQTRPSVTFQATSSSDASPFIYFQLDGGVSTRWMGQAVAIPDGTHVLAYYALDHQGQQSQQNVLTVAVDTVPPLLVVTAPQDGATVAGADEVAVRGTTDPGASVTVNGTAAEVDVAGGFAVTAGVDGQSQLLVEAIDPAGNIARSTLTLTVDATPPSLSITAPSPFQSVYTMPLVVDGTTEAGASVTVNGNAAVVQADGRFSASIAQLVEGSNLITIVARDAVGNAVTKALSVTYSSNRLIRMKIGSTTAMAGSDTLTLAVAPVIKSGTTFVPLRFVSEAFGASVQWDTIFQLIDISLGGRTIRLQINNKTAVVSGKNVALNLAPFLQAGTTMVPIRFVSEVLGARVVWDGTTKTVSIFFPGS
jgi:hypothetical protein